MKHATRKSNGGFTLIELLVVVMIIGILARVAVPQYFKVIEKDKASEAAQIFRSMHTAQERYRIKYGAYCNAAIAACPGFDWEAPVLHYFNAIGAFQAGAGAPSWKISLTRTNAPAVYGAYIMTYDVEPGAAPALTCNQANCTNDLLPNL